MTDTIEIRSQINAFFVIFGIRGSLQKLPLAILVASSVLLDLSSFPQSRVLKVFFLFISVLLVLNTLVLARERVSDLFSSVSVEDP